MRNPASPTPRRRLWLLLALLVALLAALAALHQRSPTAPVSAAAPRPSHPAPQPSPADGVAHLRLPRGAVLHAEPQPASAVVTVLDEGRLLPVVTWRDGWAQLRLADPPGSGWARPAEDPPALVWLRATGPGPQAAVAAAPELLQLARRFLEAGGRAGRCGPYALLSDVDDARLLAACDRLAAGLDAAYAQRFGVAPRGEPRETLVLFSTIGSFRRFAAASEGAGAGYSGHARASAGVAVLYAGPRSRDEVLSTLVHELTHLIHRRALGGELPRWLSEGLADALGDPAGEQGLGALSGLRGVEGQAARLRLAYGAGTVPSVQRLLSKSPAEFDQGVGSLDYEQSALLVRLLLTDPTWSPPFRSFLSDFAAGRRDDPEALRRRLAASWEELDARLRRWVEPAR